MVVKFFETLDSAAKYIEKEENENGIQYVRRSVEKSFGSDNWTNRIKGRSVMWEDARAKYKKEDLIKFSGIPYMILGRREMDCCCGVSRPKKKKTGLSIPQRHYKRIQTSRKQCCPAKIVIKELVYFLDFLIHRNTKFARQNTSSLLRSALRENPDIVQTRRCFAVRVPDVSEHSNHAVGPLLTSCLPTDRRVMAKMKELTQAGVRHVPEMQQLIRNFVCNDLFAGQPAPPRFDSRFWPSEKSIKNCVYGIRKKTRKPMSVGEAVEQLSLRNRNIIPVQAASDEHDYVLPFDPGNPADTLTEYAARESVHCAEHATDVNGSNFSTDSCNEDQQLAPLRDDVAANPVTEHVNPDTLHVVETGMEKMAFYQSCDEAEFEGSEDAEESDAIKLETDSVGSNVSNTDEGEAVTGFIHEDDQCIAFPEAHSQAPLHFVVIPKRPVGEICHCSEADKLLMGHMLVVAEHIVMQLSVAETTEYRIVINNVLRRQQAVYHPQIHVMAGREMNWPPG